MPQEIIEVMKDINVTVNTQDAVEIANAVIFYKFVVLGVIVLAAIAAGAFFLWVFLDVRQRIIDNQNP